ncbi:MAG: GTPase HflX [Thermogutta sp.]|nr:GTPase HflX [Thermogutta sp.]
MSTDEFPQAAVLAGVLLPRRNAEETPLEELVGLAEAAGLRVVGQVLQKREAPDAATYLGRGKADELRQLVHSRAADLVVFDNDLSPAQARNLEKELRVRVLDRTELILDIFAVRARTHEAQLAVELAQLEYAMPRLKRLWTHLERQTKGGVGLRGPGEKQLELDRRLTARRIHELKRELDLIHRRKQREVVARKRHKTVSLVGYTNAGKSTLMNALTGADVYVEDALFATLDTRTRRWQLAGWGPVLLSDTVGFIRDLPHHLVASFRATLEEARQADLLLHVADGSSPAVLHQISAAHKVLSEIGLQTKDTLLVINKVDKVEDRAALHALTQRYPHAIPISARTGEGLHRLSATVSESLARRFLELEIETLVENGRLTAFLAHHGEIFSHRYGSDGRTVIHCRLPEEYAGILPQLGAIRLHRRVNGKSLPMEADRDASPDRLPEAGVW